MNRQLTLALCCFTILGLALSPAAQQPPPPIIQEEIPENALFYMFFQSIAPQQEEQKERNQFATARLGQVARAARLQTDHIDTLRHFAAECVSKVAVVDEKAQKFIAFARNQRLNPNGPPAQAPSELKLLQQERDKIVSESVSGLRAALGEEAFAGLQAALKPQPGSAISVRLPDELAQPAAPDRRLQRGDFPIPRGSVYESRLPVKAMISPVGDGGPNERMRFTMDEPVRFKITLLNTTNHMVSMNTEFAMNQCSLLAMKQGDAMRQVSLRFEFVPTKGMPLEVPLPSNVPVVVGIARLNANSTDFAPGRYSGTLQRQLALPPPGNDEENRRIVETSLLSLNSNTIVFEIVP